MNSEVYVGQRRKWRQPTNSPPFTISVLEGTVIAVIYDNETLYNTYQFSDIIKYSVPLLDMEKELDEL